MPFKKGNIPYCKLHPECMPRGEKHHLYNKHHSDEMREKISIATKKAMANLTPETRIKLSPKGEHRSLGTEFKKGHLLSFKRKEEQRIIAKENGFGKWMRGRIPSFILQGKHFQYPKGENHPNWKGGITPQHLKIRHSIEYRLWRESVFARDHWNCQNCGKHKNIHAHHIKSFCNYPELRFAIDNGITLCRNCHTKVHTKNLGVDFSS